MPRNVALVASMLFGSIVATVSASPKPPHLGSCDTHRNHAEVVTRSLIVFGKPSGTDDLGSRVTAYYACLRPNGPAVELGHDAPSDGEYPSDETTGSFRIAGAFAAAISSSGQGSSAACQKNDDPPCPVPRYWISVLDARTRRHLDVPTSRHVSVDVVSAAGAIAWLDTTSVSGSPAVLHAIVLHDGRPGRLSGSVQTIDNGAIAPESLRFAGLILRWTRSGHTHSRTLR